MDNGQIPVMPGPIQGGPVPDGLKPGSASLNSQGQVVVKEPNIQEQPTAGDNPQGQPTQGVAPDGRPMVQQVNVLPQKKDIGGLVKTIVIIALSLIAVTFIGLFIWINVEYSEIKNNFDDKVIAEVNKAEEVQRDKLEADFAEREKEPYKDFAGPVDYGSLSFKYPKTWSVYVAAAATAGGDFNAYFNPGQVDAVGKDTINALRVSILDKSFETVTEQYKKDMEKKDSGLSVESATIYNTTANRYTGKIPGTELSGIIVIFKIRDKAVIMQTDSMTFKDDFDKILSTVTFVE